MRSLVLPHQSIGMARPRVFPSLCDVFEQWDGPIVNAKGERMARDTVKGHGYLPTTMRIGRDLATMADIFRDFLALIDQTPNLDWPLLTKRPENIRKFWTLPMNGRDPAAEDYLVRDNVWLLYSASDQETLDVGLPHLLKCRDLVPVLGLSLEPLIGPVDLGFTRGPTDDDYHGWHGDGPIDFVVTKRGQAISWVICGGESGPNARPCFIEWVDDLRRQCEAAGVDLMFKQWGAWCPWRPELALFDDKRQVYPNGDWIKWGIAPAKFTSSNRSALMVKTGKKIAGRLLDGKIHDGGVKP